MKKSNLVAIIFILSGLVGFVPLTFIDANSDWLIGCFMWFFVNTAVATSIVIAKSK